MGNNGWVSDKAVREQAVRLTRASFRKINPPPVRSVEKVAPVVYALLIEDVSPDLIEQALINASAHTADAIRYSLHRLLPKAEQRRHEVWQPPVPIPFNPSDEEREAARKIIAETRAVLRGHKPEPG